MKKSLKDAWKHRLDDDVSAIQSDLSASTNPEKIQKKLNKKQAKKDPNVGTLLGFLIRILLFWGCRPRVS